MEVTQAVLLLLHPIAALLVIREFSRQRKWRVISTTLKGDEREKALVEHERAGDLMLRYVIAVICLGFAARILSSYIDGHAIEPSLVLPGHFHGWAGILGLALMYYLWKQGRATSDAKSAGLKFARIKNLHGKVSDVMMILIAIHAFLAFFICYNSLVEINELPTYVTIQIG